MLRKSTCTAGSLPAISKPVLTLAVALVLASCSGTNIGESDTSVDEEDNIAEENNETDEGNETDESNEVASRVVSMDATLFDTSETDILSVTTVDCTLSDGTETQCYEFTSSHQATEHDMGPWCPEFITSDASDGGLWFDKGELNALDGPFIENLATFYDDDGFKMYEDDGQVRRMETQQECQDGADPQIEDEYVNFCAQCLVEHVETVQTYQIPITPVLQDESVLLSDGPTLEERGVDYGPSVRGLAFNGVRYDHPADIDIILAGYQIAPVDVAGGHVNNSLGYHYHGDTGMTTRFEQEDGHSALIGYALDGFGLYAKIDADGNDATDLDECRGHEDDTRGYHYHVLGLESNEFLDCFFGAYAVSEDEEGQQGPGGGGGGGGQGGQ